MIQGTLTLQSISVTGSLTVDGSTITGELMTVPNVITGSLNIQAGPPGPAGADGEPGADGVDGLPGADGVDGVDGAPGVGVPVGGTSGQILAKIDATDYNTEWVDAPTGGGEGGGSVQVVSADITRVADGVGTYTDIPELSLTVPFGETKHLWYTLYYDEKSEGIRFQVSGVGRFNTAGFPPTRGQNYFYDTSQPVGRASEILQNTISPVIPAPITFTILDSTSSAPINVLLIRAMVHAPSEDVTVNIGFRANGSGGSTLELKKGSSLEIK